LGTGGGILLALQHVKNEEAVLILNGDTFFKINFTEYYHCFQNTQADACIALHQSADTQRYAGVAVDTEHRITDFHQPKSTIVNGGIYLLYPNTLIGHYPLHTKLSLEQDILPDLVDRYCVTGYIESAPFIDIGIPDDYHTAQQLIN